jgi:hypothetical protein
MSIQHSIMYSFSSLEASKHCDRCFCSATFGSKKFVRIETRRYTINSYFAKNQRDSAIGGNRNCFIGTVLILLKIRKNLT